MFDKLYIRKIAKKIGLDKAIAYSSGARVIQAFAGVASIFFISRYLSGVEQGFYYTFGSIVAIQTFFELGLTSIITQYVAHEVSHLNLTPNNIFDGEVLYKSRLTSLLKFSVKWYFAISILFFFVLLVTGFFFFNKFSEYRNEISWRIPWALISLGTAIKLFQSPLASFLMGLGLVKEINKIGFYQQLILPLSAWLGLICGFKLYVVGISSLLSVLIWHIYISQTHMHCILRNIWNEHVTERVLYSKEIFPYQWRIALSWISGYFIFQLFNPVLFATEGSIVAGQMGMTLAVLNGIQAFSMSWLNTKVPLYSRLIALKDYAQLDVIFQRSLKQMAFISLLLIITFLLGMQAIRLFNIYINGSLLIKRFLPYTPMFFLIIAFFINLFINSWATYLRCHKKEPFLVISIVGGILCALSTILLGKSYGVIGMTLGYSLITIFLAIWAYKIYKLKKQSWHNEIISHINNCNTDL